MNKIIEKHVDENCKLHREDGPAVSYADGSQFWYYHGEYHREDVPAVIYPDGTQFWYYHEKRHREDGPAVIYPDGRQFWYYHGKKHREDGPAAIWPAGRQEWWYNDINITNKVRQWAEERGIDIDNMTDIDKMALKFDMAGFVK